MHDTSREQFINTGKLTSFLRIIHLMMALIAGTSLILLAGNVDTTNRVQALATPVAALLIVAVSHWRLRYGLNQSINLISWGIWTLLMADIVVYGGSRSVMVIALPFLVTFAGWLLGSRSAYLMAGLTGLVLGAIAWASMAGIHEPMIITRPIVMAAIQSMILMINAYLVVVARRSLERSNSDARDLSNQLGLKVLELTQREREVQLIIDSVPVGIAAFDLERRVRFANRRYADLLDTTPQALHGRCADDLLSGSALAVARPMWDQCLREGATVNYRRTRSDKEGNESVLDVEIIPDFEDGRIVGTIVMLRDVTVEIQAEQEIRELNESLEQRVELRTAELQEVMKNLTRSQEGLARAERMAALGALVAGVSHELNTPIGNSVMAASTMADHTRTVQGSIEEGQIKRSQLTQFLGQLNEGFLLLQRNLQRAEDLLRSFKQVAADQTSDNRRQFDLGKVIAEVVETLAPSLKRKPHKLELDLASSIRMDSFPGPLGQVLINLVNNAYLHAFDDLTENGKVRITARRQGFAEGMAGVLILVEDNGRGIPDAHLSRIFEPFFTTRMGQGGTGLGLNIVYNTIHGLLGGRIEVRSQPGMGTTFEILLPVVAPMTASPALRT